MTVKRPRIHPEMVALIDSVRGGVPFERFVNDALSEHLRRHRLDPRELAKLAAKESGMSGPERHDVLLKIDANADNGADPRAGLTFAEERVFDVLIQYMPTGSEEDRIVFRRAYWGDHAPR